MYVSGRLPSSVLSRQEPGIAPSGGGDLPHVLQRRAATRLKFYLALTDGRDKSQIRLELIDTDYTFLNERLASANWLVKSLHQRATTILKVASEIVRQQDAFFQHGVQHLLQDRGLFGIVDPEH